MNEARCHFCGASFRNRQAVRAHLRHCSAYQGRQAKTGSRQGRLPVDGLAPHNGAAELRTLLEAHEKRRREEAAAARKQKRRQLIQRVKDQVVGQYRSSGYTIPAETKARALTDIERELSALALEELPEWELVQLAEGIRDQLYGPAMRAQDEAQRVEDQRREEAQEASRRVTEQRANEDRERQQAKARASALVRYGTTFADDALQDVEDLDEPEQQRILQRVELDLEQQLTGGESKRDVQGRVDQILDEELGEVEDGDEDEGDDGYDEDDDQDEDGDEDEGDEDDDHD
jgi:hypothetical protein